MLLLQALVSIRDYGPVNEQEGICGNAKNILEEEGYGYLTIGTAYFLIQELSLSWPKHSGNKIYPVPHCTISPMEAYHYCTDCWYSQYEEYNQYVSDRWELLDYLITELEKQIDE